MSEKPTCPPRPCASCPYRTDTPKGLWAPEEYGKLPGYDQNGLALAPFHCHQENATGKPTLCRGWVSCHQFDSVAVRLAVSRGLLTVEDVARPCPVELYPSGAAACKAGLSGVRRPGVKARAAIEKLMRTRAGRA